MARPERRLAENAPGALFVDDTCIDCETCRQIAPAVFKRDARVGMSVVSAQPGDEANRRRAAMAVVACPTASIGTRDKTGLKDAARSFPEPIGDEIYYCGYASEASFGASSYLVRRPDGNVLVDSPRAAGPLLEQIDRLGGVRWMFLTHRDDVADHRAFHKRYGCERILHAADVGRRTRDVERQLEGQEPIRLADDLLIIPVPGHTPGSAALLFKDVALFTGDHLWGDEDDGRLSMGRHVCWYSWPEQLDSLERLESYAFTRVLPGHGRPFRAPTGEAMREELRAARARLGRA
jgi:glyoxylase-like metal-dependent hydrolase (beta-lactamase superfamily II)/ferredoxin